MMINIRTLTSLPLPARVFYRADYNVPLDGSRITDATRIEETLPTLRRLRDAGCSLVIASHLGRPKGQRNPKYSLAPVRAKLAELLGTEVQWADDCLGADVSTLRPGDVLLLDNESVGVATRLNAGRAAMLTLASDLLITHSPDAPTTIRVVGAADGVPNGMKAVDIGPRSVSQYAAQFGSARMVFWNGPM